MVNSFQRITTFFLFYLCLLPQLLTPAATLPDSRRTSSLPFYQQLEQTIAHLTDQLMAYTENVDELIPALIEIAGIYGASYVVMPKNSRRGSQTNGFLKRLGIGFLVQSLATIAHETGHALAAKLCKCTNIRVHLGDKNPQSSPLAKLNAGSISYTIHTPYIINGEAAYSLPAEGISRLQEAFIAVAGGSAATAALYLMKVISHLKHNRGKKYSSPRARIKDALYHALAPDSATAFQLINALIPLEASNDGTKFWNALLNKR
ncbi:TPA: hypothetical protein DCW54_03480 [Candidatus Dependentiae bacterium]|nr:hypothetical protein [Candidatus Dependentiae bacterium]